LRVTLSLHLTIWAEPSVGLRPCFERFVMKATARHIFCVFACAAFSGLCAGGPYTEVGVNGYVGDDRRHADPFTDADARLNPIFRGWATGYKDYVPADSDWWGGSWNEPARALGPVTGDNFDIVSLGDLDDSEIVSGAQPGEITLIFGDPCLPGDANHIRDVNGYDFAVFENGFMSGYDTGAGSVRGQMLAELAYVEVSSNGVDFARFASVSLTAGPVGPYGTIEVSDVFGLAGKHPNAYGLCTGTAFDLAQLSRHPLVLAGVVDLNDICYVRIVDLPGSGDYYDTATELIDPASRPDWREYAANGPIYDAWVTEGSGGFDLEAVGVLKEQRYSGDVNLDGVVDLYDFALFASAWGSYFGDDSWISRCDLALPKNLSVDIRDFEVFSSQWLQTESWRIE